MTKETRHWKQGTKVFANGYAGVIVRQYSCRMWEVRLPGGVACLCDSDITELASNQVSIKQTYSAAPAAPVGRRET